ncbi:unnamed protein product [Pseudo-nitzschia multistriata]|uniref:Uncharacterized protein n=1 Tax=Pseudo-nitzschia multistriata TaxID=183589 RepID=A0A448ZM18_9STRA|nr:unnamed protein product [Pseudo-nitzschia multistriata]
MSNIGFCSIAVAKIREIRPNIAKRPLMISASSVRPVLNSGMYPKGLEFRSIDFSYDSSSGSNKRESPKGSGQIVAMSEMAKKCMLAAKIMARPCVMVPFPVMVARVPHSLRSKGTSMLGINPCPLA